MEKLILMIIFFVSLVPTIYLLIIFYQPYHRQSDFSETNEEEKKALSAFYDSDIISEGKYFDLKFTYFEPCTDKAVMEIVKKTDADLGEIYIKTWDENNELIASRNYFNFEASKWLLGWEEDRRYLRYVFGDDFLDRDDIKTNYEDNMVVKVTISYERQEEVHEIAFDLKKNIKELERQMKDPVTNAYEGQLASCYYGLLLSYDKERWFQKVNKLIEEDKNKYLDYTRILKTSSNTSSSIRNGKYQDLQDLYQFNDEEYAEYLRMVQRASEKDLFKNSAG